MLNKLVASLVVAAVMLSVSSFAHGHDVFQDVLKEQYMLKSFSCKACHPDGDDRKIRTAFAERIYLQMKDKGLSKQFAAATATDEAAKKADPSSVTKEKGAVVDFEKLAAKEFKVAFVEVSKQKMSIEEILREGMFNGARLDTKAIEAAAAAANEEK
ncbi:MAG: hypothetical protein ACI87E_005271 [Mariniblastus sp.]|jgi:hypothetical protein